MAEAERVQRWLAERRHLLVELVGLSRTVRSRSANLESLGVRLQMFCDRLVDYVSAGHFEVYADLATSADGARLLARLWSQLKGTTDKVLRFNEHANRRQVDRQRLTIALAELSLALEDRFTIEDRLVTTHRAIQGKVLANAKAPTRVAVPARPRAKTDGHRNVTRTPVNGHADHVPNGMAEPGSSARRSTRVAGLASA